jgi:serine/threonine-protein kinase
VSRRLPPSLAERYIQPETLGKGAYGRVFKAVDSQTGERVALKLLHPKVYEDAGMMRRFEREAELTQRIDSPHVARVLDHGLADGRPYIAFAFVDGPDLQLRLDTSPDRFPLEEAGRIFWQVLEGVAAAHAEGVMHRDLKPDNVLVAPDGSAVITDFGLSRTFDSQSVTQAGEMIGTATHMTPQQLTGAEADASSDIYGAAMIFYELVTRSDPFPARNFLKLRTLKMEGLKQSLHDHGVACSPRLDQLVTDALSGDEARRPQDAAAFAAQVREALADPEAPAEERPASNTGWTSPKDSSANLKRPRVPTPDAPVIPRQALAGMVAGIGMGLVLAIVLVLWGP